MSYARADADVQERLSLVLRPLVREGHLEIWADHRIRVGSPWDEEIEANLRRADVAVLLVSHDFLASDYIMGVELPRLVERGVPLVCVPVGDCAWRDLEEIAAVQWPLSPERPLRRMPRAQRERALVRVYEAVKELLAGLDPVGEDQGTPEDEAVSTTSRGEGPSLVVRPPSAPRPGRGNRFEVAHRPWAVGLAITVVVLLALATFEVITGEAERAQPAPSTSTPLDVTSSSAPEQTSTTVPVEASDPGRGGASGSSGSGGNTREAGLPPLTGAPGSDAASPPAMASPASPEEPPQAGQWRAPPSGLSGHCMGTEQSGPNLWYQICWSGATPMMVVTVTGVTGQSPTHEVAVPRIWTVVNGVHSRGTRCPIRTVTIAQSFACVDETGPSGPGTNVESFGRLQHDGVESTLFTRRI